METKFFCTRWGSENLTWDDFMRKVKNTGYDGIEFGIPKETTDQELETIWETSEKYQLLLIPQHYDTYDSNFAAHYDAYGKWLQRMEAFKGLKIDSQTGKDYFTFEQNKALIDLASGYTERTGVPLYHETHRNKFTFAAHITKEYLQKIPSLTITLDISHWVNVAESFLEDQAEAVDLAIDRARHLHARIGYPEGPQVMDPRAPEWADAVKAHLQWWAKVAKKTAARNELFTVTPEFGPYPYMVHVPYTQAPISSQWDINFFMMEMIRKRLNDWT